MFPTINAGESVWMLLSAALVFLLVPGFAFFYGGLFGSKDISSVLKFGFTGFCLVSLQWIFFGYSLSYGPDHNGWIGNLAWSFLRGVGEEPNLEYAGSVSHQTLMIYRLMMAAVPPVILFSACADRIKMSAFCLYTLLWTTIVYDPVSHWVWSLGGFLRLSGTLDFAGGAAIQMSSGMSILAATLVLGKRPASAEPNIPFAILGGGLLWFGWYGLAIGSSMLMGTTPAKAFINFHVAAVVGGLVWSTLDAIFHKEFTLIGLIAGALMGLVTLAPAAGHVSIWGALLMGVLASVAGYAALVLLEKKFTFGNAIFPFVLHGIGGILGLLAAGHFGIQLKAVLAVSLYSFGMSYLLLKSVNFLIGLSEHALQTGPEDESAG